jgi:sulfate/thiosulfate transport system substrate-binding protein
MLIPRSPLSAAGLAVLAGLALLLTGCGKSSAPPSPGSAPLGPVVIRTLTLGAYTTPREVYGKAIIPAFQRFWKARTGQEVKFQESYLGSGAQARAIIGGFQADVAALSLEPDIAKIAAAGLITHDWKQGPSHGMVTRSLVVIAVRPGNPQQIQEWDDLRRPGLQILTPSPRTSGGAMWNICALYGAALRGSTSVPRGDPAAAAGLVGQVLKNVPVMDKGARESIISFEKGVGNAAITYENEVLVGRMSGRSYDYKIPHSTILIENPVALVDHYVDRHGNRDVAAAFVKFLTGPEAQRAFADFGLRPVDPTVAQETLSRFPLPVDLFTIRDLGGWPAMIQQLLAPGAVFDQVTAGSGAGTRGGR